MAFVLTSLAWPVAASAQAHDHTAMADARSRDARLELVLGGPHLILHHRGYLGLDDGQVVGLLRLRRTVCEAEVAYTERTAGTRDRLSGLLSDSAKAAPLREAMAALAAAESEWLIALLHARRDALALLSPAQREQAHALRDHWAREAVAMIDETTRPGQRGHPGMQVPIRVPGMVVGATTLLPHCEALHGPSTHISVPPPR